jgi:hypothetical protein
MFNEVVPPEKYFARAKKISGRPPARFLERKSRVGFHPGPALSGIVWL